MAIAFNPDGNLYITDYFHGRVQIYSPIGEKEGQFGGDLGYVKGIAINSNGTVFVAEWSGVGIQIFDGQGHYLGHFGQFGYPNFVAINSAGTIFITAIGQVLMYSLNGTPGAPSNLNLTGGINSIQLNWTEPAINGGSPITGYLIYRGTSPGAEILCGSVVNQTSYTDWNLTKSGTYYYTVVAFNGVGNGIFSQKKALPSPSRPHFCGS